jgi:hypothetical protein
MGSGAFLGATLYQLLRLAFNVVLSNVLFVSLYVVNNAVLISYVV